MCASFSDNVGIKTTVQTIVAARQGMTLPKPVTRADFLKCKCAKRHGELKNKYK